MIERGIEGSLTNDPRIWDLRRRRHSRILAKSIATFVADEKVDDRLWRYENGCDDNHIVDMETGEVLAEARGNARDEI